MLNFRFPVLPENGVGKCPEQALLGLLTDLVYLVPKIEPENHGKV